MVLHSYMTLLSCCKSTLAADLQMYTHLTCLPKTFSSAIFDSLKCRLVCGVPNHTVFFISHPCSCSCLLCAQILILWFTYRLIWASCTVHATTCQYARTAYCHLPCKIKCERQTWKWKKEDRIRERERKKAAWKGTGIRGRWKIHKQNILKQLME